MSNYENAYSLLEQLEYGADENKFLHKNKTESSITLGGIYRKANPTAIDWDFVDKVIDICGIDIERASRILYNDKYIYSQVKRFFKNAYWDALKLDEIQSQKIAEEMFTCGVLCGVKTAAKIAQKTVGVKEDGIIGTFSLKALNRFSPSRFDLEFDELEIEHFERIAATNKDLEIYLRGWRNRSVIV